MRDAAGAMQVVVPAGATHAWYDSFVMPEQSVTVTAVSWYLGGDDTWYPDDRAEEDVGLEAGDVPDSDFGLIEIAGYERRA